MGRWLAGVEYLSRVLSLPRRAGSVSLSLRFSQLLKSLCRPRRIAAFSPQFGQPCRSWLLERRQARLAAVAGVTFGAV